MCENIMQQSKVGSDVRSPLNKQILSVQTNTETSLQRCLFWDTSIVQPIHGRKCKRKISFMEDELWSKNPN